MIALVLLAFLGALQPTQTLRREIEKVDSSRCWVFSDFKNIWTLEMVEG
jgi:hypothetical protein